MTERILVFLGFTAMAIVAGNYLYNHPLEVLQGLGAGFLGLFIAYLITLGSNK